MFNGNGLIVNPNNPRPAQPAGDPYGQAYTPQVRFDSLRDRNRRNFNIGQPNGGMPAMTVDLACHHVIGWDILWGFWNRLISDEAFELARKHLALFGVPQTATKNMAKDMGKGTWADQWGCEAKMCWKPNNIVRGPNDRSDDPNINPELENKIDFKMVSDSVYKGRLPLLCETGRYMVRFITDGTVTYAEKAIDYLHSIRAAKIMEWSEDLWVVDETFPGYSNTPAIGGGFAVVRPTWKIHASRT
ncbi:MAG TPA: hypothetical protein VMA74_07605 [Dyella sp.]|uniref:hypothetical protein n=1 Tax=Dyella sp. TaxID=1869338 RepID=UPI002C3A96A8|nr:hypothetical protein [Dyella sp.]HUB89581.1 hypothetical protein [Dyella sp.]